MKTIEFCKLYKPCPQGREFAERYENMTDVWNNCDRHDWLFWICEKHAPLEKAQSVKLAVVFAEACIDLCSGDDRPRAAIDAAKAWLDNPCEETRMAAAQMADAAWMAAEAARTAERTARTAWSAAGAAVAAQTAWSAAGAAWAAAGAADAAQTQLAKTIREIVKNPFEE